MATSKTSHVSPLYSTQNIWNASQLDNICGCIQEIVVLVVYVWFTADSKTFMRSIDVPTNAFLFSFFFCSLLWLDKCKLSLFIFISLEDHLDMLSPISFLYQCWVVFIVIVVAVCTDIGFSDGSRGDDLLNLESFVWLHRGLLSKVVIWRIRVLMWETVVKNVIQCWSKEPNTF